MSRTVNRTAVLLASFAVVEIASAYYNARVGRFISRDPITELGAHVAASPSSITRNRPQLNDTLKIEMIVAFETTSGLREPNVYAYVLNNPVQNIDPVGLECSPPNGCTFSPDRPFGFDFTDCCNKHDECYCTCGKEQEDCDDNFRDCMQGVCDRLLTLKQWAEDAGNYWEAWKLQFAYSMCPATLYYTAVSNIGHHAYSASQRDEGCCDE